MPHFYSILQNLTEILGDGRFLCEFFVALLVIFVSRLFQIRSGGKVSSQYAPVEMRDSSPQPIYLAHKEWKGGSDVQRPFANTNLWSWPTLGYLRGIHIHSVEIASPLSTSP